MAEQPGYIHQAVTSLTQRTRQALSPWVRRRLQATAHTSPLPLDTRRRATLTLGNTRSLLDRVQRTVDRAVVWKPDVDSLRPASVERFASTIANRFQALQLIGVRRQPAPPTSVWEGDLDLTLPGGSTPSGAEGLTTPGVFSVGQRIEPLSSIPPTLPRTPRSATPARATRKPPRKKLSPTSRLYTRVEEIPPRGKAPPTVSSQQPKGAAEMAQRVEPPVQPGQPERRAEPRQVAVPPPVQRQEAVEEEEVAAIGLSAEQPEEAMPERPARRPGPPRVTEAPPVQRQAEPGTPRRARPAREVVPEQPERRPEPRRVAEPPPVQREEASEMVLRAEPPTEAPPARPGHREAVPPPIQRLEAVEEKAPEAVLRAEPPTEAPPARLERREAVPPPIQRREAVEEKVSEMVLQVEPPTEAPPARPEHREAMPPPIQRREAVEENAPELTLRVEPPTEAPPARSERREAMPPSVQRQEMQEAVWDVSRRVQPSQVGGPAPITGELATPLGKDVLARATSRARVSLSSAPSPAISRTVAKARPKAGKGAPRPAAPGIRLSALRHIRARVTSPALYSRSPDIYIGPSASLTIPGLKSTYQVQRRADVRHGLRMRSQRPTPPSPATHLWAIYEAWKAQDERLPLARPPQPATSSTPTRPSKARSGPGSTIQPRELSLPLPLPPVPQPPQLQVSPSETIQREPATIVGTLVQRDTVADVVQRAEGEDSESEEELDLAELAERIYPLVKRLLAIERERMPGRSA